MSISSDLTQALIARLATIKQAAGYVTDIKKVFYPLGTAQYQPMGGDMAPHEMPGLIVYQGPVQVEPQHSLNNMIATYYVEIVREWCPDSDMWDAVSDIGKAVFGGSSTATENTSYRFHPSVVEPKIESITPDFGMLTGHRIWVVVLLVHYRARYTNL